MHRKPMRTLALLLLLLVASLGRLQPPVACDQLGPEPQPAYPRPVKRSFCNTFGGCGTKRALADLSRASFGSGQAFLRNADLAGGQLELATGGAPPANANTNNHLGQPAEAGQGPQALRAKLIGEIIQDLLEHLQWNRRFRQGKLVLVLPAEPAQQPEPAGPFADEPQ